LSEAIGIQLFSIPGGAASVKISRMDILGQDLKSDRVLILQNTPQVKAVKRKAALTMAG